MTDILTIKFSIKWRKKLFAFLNLVMYIFLHFEAPNPSPPPVPQFLLWWWTVAFSLFKFKRGDASFKRESLTRYGSLTEQSPRRNKCPYIWCYSMKVGPLQLTRIHWPYTFTLKLYSIYFFFTTYSTFTIDTAGVLYTGGLIYAFFKQINLSPCAQASSRSEKHAQFFVFFGTTNRLASALIIS